MSALGSSVINKSGKKFAPKAPARRALPATSTQSSTRPSVDRQLYPQTPQPQPVQQHVASSPTPSVSLSQITSTQRPKTNLVANASRRDEATSVSIPSRISTSLEHESPPPEVPQKRLASPSQLSHSPTPISPVVNPSRASQSSSPLLTRNDTSFGHTDCFNVPELSSTDTHSGGTAQNTSADVSVPSPKRRRVERFLDWNRTDVFQGPKISANLPIPSTEKDATVAGSLDDTLALSVSQPIIAAKNPRVSAQDARRQHIADAAAGIVADATRGPHTRLKNPLKSTKGKGVQRAESGNPRSNADVAHESLNQAEENAATTKSKRRYTKKRARQSIEDAAAEIVQDAVQGASKDPKTRDRRRNRAPTPEAAETIKITPSEVRMMDLCRDSGAGRKSEREKELEELERADFVRKKQRQLKEVMGEAGPESQTTPLESMEERQERLERQSEQEQSVARNVPNTIIVNGQIQIDESSLEIDRHAAAALERDAEQLDAIDETDMTRKINSATWLKRDKSGGWNEMLTERFYDGLRMFGTDFEMISKMFPGRTRHKIKLKFCKEEKSNGSRIKATLLGEKLAVNLPELEKMAGTEFDDPQELENDLEEDRIRLQEETAAEKQAMDEAKRERLEQIAAEQAAAENDSSAKENRRGKGKKKGSKGKRGEKHERSTSRKKDKQAQTAGSADRGDVPGALEVETR